MIGPDSFRSGKAFFAAIFVAAFGLNFIWEIAQMPAYEEISERPLLESAAICGLAGVGDAAVTLGIYGVGTVIVRRLRARLHESIKPYILLAILAALSAVAIEAAALSAGYWTYLDGMPVITGLGVGLLPVIQLTLLVPLAIRSAVWWEEG